MLVDQGDGGSMMDAGRPAFDAGVRDGGGGARDAGPDAPASDDDGGPADAGCTTCCCAAVCAFETEPIPSTCGGASDTTSFSFESGTQGWGVQDNDGVDYPGRVAVSTERAFAGSSSLRATLDVPAADSRYVYIPVPPEVPLGATLTFHVWLPADSPIGSIQPYIMDADFVWSGHWIAVDDLALGCWMSIEVPVPPTFARPLFRLGVQFAPPVGAAFSGDVYIDAVSWSMP